MAVFYALIVGVVIYREISIANLYVILRKSVISSAVIMFIIANAGLFAFLITRAGVPGRDRPLARGRAARRPPISCWASTRRCS